MHLHGGYSTCFTGENEFVVEDTHGDGLGALTRADGFDEGFIVIMHREGDTTGEGVVL